MKPLSFPQFAQYSDHPRVYRFDLPFAAQGVINSCRVDIYSGDALAPESPLTVVVGDTPGCQGPSPTNNMEMICSLIWHTYLVPLRLADEPMRWLQRFPPALQATEQWREVHFRGTAGRFSEPTWTATEPVHLTWDRLLPDTCWVEEIRLINPEDISEDELAFTPDECHRELTGVCSLEKPLPSDLGDGRSAWHYCRHLARMGEVWRLILNYVGRDYSMAALDTRALEVNKALWDHIERNWHTDFGSLPELLPMAIRAAIRAFGPRQAAPISLSGEVPYELTDGRHRACIAGRMGVQLCGTTTVERTRKQGGDGS